MKRTSVENYSICLMVILIYPWVWISSVFKAIEHKFSPFYEHMRGTICGCDYSCCQICAVVMMYFFPYWWYRWKPLSCKSFRISVGAVAYQRLRKFCMFLDKGFAPLQPELYLLGAGFGHFFLQSLVWRNPSHSKVYAHPQLFRRGTQRSGYCRLNSAAGETIAFAEAVQNACYNYCL